MDSLGNAYVAGNFRAGGTPNPFFPVTPDAFQSSFTKLSGDAQEAFLTKLNPNGTALIYSSYLGGEGDDVATAIAIDQIGDAYVTGHTGSASFPVTAGAFQTTVDGTGDAFVTKFPIAAFNTLSISSIAPSSGGNAGNFTATIIGGGFVLGSAAELVCPGVPAIIGANVVNGTNGRTLTATFDLTGASTGSCDAVVMNPDGTSIALASAFTVQQGGATDMSVEIIGFSRLGAGVGQHYYIVVSNRGNIDSEPGTVWMGFPNFLNFTFDPNGPPTSSYSSGGMTFVVYGVSSVAAGATVALPVEVTAPVDPQYIHFPVEFQSWYSLN